MTDQGKPRSTGAPTPTQGYFVPIDSIADGEDVDLLKVWRSLTRYKIMSLIIVVVTTTLAVLSAFSITPVYRSEILLAPADAGAAPQGLAALAGQFSGLASLAGVSMGGTANVSEPIAILKSRNFTNDFIAHHDLMPELFAEDWDESRRDWIDKDAISGPTISDAFELFDEEVRRVKHDSESGLVTLAIEWSDRFRAAEWANRLVANLNEFLRLRDIAEAEKSIEFLRTELSRTSNIELQQGIARLIEHQIERIMLANVRQEYAFRILDTAVVADVDDFVWPKRIPIILVGMVLGFCFALAITIVRNILSTEELRASN